MGALRFGPAALPEAASFPAAIADLRGRGYDACEFGFLGSFWLDYDGAAALGAAAREADVLLSVHAPLAAFMGHADDGKKFKMALGMLDHTAGLAKTAGAELIVVHPGFLLGRDRAAAIDAVVRQLGLLRERLEAKDRLMPFGVEVMGRVRDLGTADDVLAIAGRLEGWIRPVLDFAHMHATSDGAFTDAEAFPTVLERADKPLMRAEDNVSIFMHAYEDAEAELDAFLQYAKPSELKEDYARLVKQHRDKVNDALAKLAEAEQEVSAYDELPTIE